MNFNKKSLKGNTNSMRMRPISILELIPHYHLLSVGEIVAHSGSILFVVAEKTLMPLFVVSCTVDAHKHNCASIILSVIKDRGSPGAMWSLAPWTPIRPTQRVLIRVSSPLRMDLGDPEPPLSSRRNLLDGIQVAGR